MTREWVSNRRVDTAIDDVRGIALMSLISIVVPRVAHAGDRVKWDARVSPDVVTVTARVAVYTFSLYLVRHGHFGETFRIPKDVPPFFHGNYSVTITATTASGATAQRSVALIFE